MVSEAQSRARAKYRAKGAAIEYRTTQEKRDAIRAAAAAAGQSVNSYITQAIAERMERDGLTLDSAEDAGRNTQ